MSNLSRVVVIVWVFVVLILQSSYIASLTSMLTVQQFRPTVSDFEELKHSGQHVGYLKSSFTKGLLLKLGFEESKLKPFRSPQQYHEALSNGSVAAIIDEIPYLRVFLKDYCDNYTMAGQTYKTGGFGYVSRSLSLSLSCNSSLTCVFCDASSGLPQRVATSVGPVEGDPEHNRGRGDDRDRETMVR